MVVGEVEHVESCLYKGVATGFRRVEDRITGGFGDRGGYRRLLIDGSYVSRGYDIFDLGVVA